MKRQSCTLPGSFEKVRVAFEKRLPRILQHYGIDYGGEKYSSPALSEIRKYKIKPDVQIAVDRENMGSVVVICPFTGKRYRAQCTTRNDLEGVPRLAYQAANKYSKEHKISKARAMRELRAVEVQAVKKGSVKKVRKRAFAPKHKLPSPLDLDTELQGNCTNGGSKQVQEKKKSSVFDLLNMEGDGCD